MKSKTKGLKPKNYKYKNKKKMLNYKEEKNIKF